MVAGDDRPGVACTTGLKRSPGSCRTGSGSLTRLLLPARRILKKHPEQVRRVILRTRAEKDPRSIGEYQWQPVVVPVLELGVFIAVVQAQRRCTQVSAKRYAHA